MTKSLDSTAHVATSLQGLGDLRKSARENSPEALKAAAQQFEAVMLSMVMKSMRDASGEDALFGSEQGKMFGSMLDSQLSQVMASRGTGLADLLVRHLSRGVDAGGKATPVADPGPPATTSRLGEGATLPSPSLSGATRPIAAYRQHGDVQGFRSRFNVHAESVSQATGLPASFVLGQVALETGYGKREIRFADGSPSHNVFSIKAGKSWSGKTVDVQTTEFVDGKARKSVEKFRAYDNYADAFADYATLLKKSDRYQRVLVQTESAIGFGLALQSAGYATDPDYGVKVARAIERTSEAGA